MATTDVIRKLQTAVARHQSGEIASAKELYAEVLREDPANADAWHLTGLADLSTGDPVQAEQSIRRAIQLKPDEPEFRSNLAAVLVNQQRSTEAEDLCRDILRTDARHTKALSHLGTALRQQKRLQESYASFQQAAEQQRDAAVLCNLGGILIDLGRLDEAHTLLTEARDQAPHLPEVHINLGVIQREQGDISGALASLAAADRLMPSSYEVCVNRGNLFLENGQPLDAVEQFQAAIAVNSSLPSAVSGLGRALQNVSCWEESLEAHRLAAELNPSDQKYQSSYLYAASLSPLLSPKAVYRRHADWGQQTEASVVPIVSHVNDLSEDRPLRIGYVSPDLRSHATMRFLYPLLTAHDRNAFELYFYSETGCEDTVTEKVKELSSGWCATRGLSDDAVSQQIQNDRIDILVDLAGHTSENRLPVFARKPAPVQVSFLGYPATTGLSRIDWFLTDAVREPDHSAEHFSEQPVLLPHGACCYQASNAPAISEPPFRRNGCVTLGSTHRLEKISPQAIQLWAMVMAAVPNARLRLFRDSFRSADLRTQLQQTLMESGINTARVDFGWELPEQHLNVYADIDILLDVLPWGSGTVAYDCMWMGVPIPSIPGDRGGCRATASLLHFCGFPDLIAANEDDYVKIVSGLAADPDRLAALRTDIRPAMQKTVCNSDQFARDVEAAYRQMWTTYVESSRKAGKDGC